MRKRSAEQKRERRNEVFKTLRGLIVPGIIALIIGGVMLFAFTYKNVEEEEQVIPVNGYIGDGQEIVLENDQLRFTFDPATTYFTVLVKSSGKIWTAIPDDVDSDTIAMSSEKGHIRSTLNLTYSDDIGAEVPLNNFTYSIENQTFDVETDGESIIVHYSIGKAQKEFVIPPVCTAEEFEALLALADQTQTSFIQQYYKKFDINKIDEKKYDKKELLEKYPALADHVLYILRDTATDAVKAKLQGIFEGLGYTYEMYLADKELDLSIVTNDNPIFNVDLIYRLDGGSLIVEMPYSSMLYPKERPILNIDVLPFFGAGGMDDEGFMFVPEGGGALINFNNGKISQNVYYANVYGWDMCHQRDAVVHNTNAVFNTFGISDGHDSFICTIEGGSAYAAIEADIAGRFNSYNFVNAEYGVLEREQYNVGSIANNQVYVYQEFLPDEVISQRYTFIDSGSYVDMAEGYRDYLLANYGDYMKPQTDTQAPVVIEIVGAVDKVRQIVGVPVSRPLELTTYDEARDIVSTLNSEGMNNMIVKLTGWCNGGVNQAILKDIDTVWALGSASDLKKLCQTASELGCQIYLDGITEYAYNSDIFDGFFAFADSSRFISRELSQLYPYSTVTYGIRDGLDGHYLLHEQLVIEMMNNLYKASNKYGATGPCFQDIGTDLSSDFSRSNPVSREQSLVDQSAQLRAVRDNGTNVMINSGNIYAAVYSNVISRVDLKGSEYTILDETVPFLEIAIHGYITYTGEPVNISGRETDSILECAEYGAGLCYNVMAEDVEALQKTLYPMYYGSSYEAVHDRMLETYTRYNNELGHIFNQQMTGHENITSFVSCTEYADGTRVYVNYGYTDYVADGITIPARDYKVVK
ncbi:MAG: hypothetical protein K5871_00815 [Lachnospiraceae bacterium]|nr:hypothetical protein [Lachnospiraceae bacterium]